MTNATGLAVAAAAFDALGIALVGAADYVPQVRRGAARFGRWLSRVWGWFRARVLRRPRTTTAKVGLGGAIAMGGELTAMTSTSADTLEGKVEYLLRESERTQRRLNDLEGASERRRRELEAELQQLQGEVLEHFERAISESFTEYVSARRLGLVCLGIGLVLFTLAALL